MAVIAGGLHAIACGSPGAHLNPGVTLGLAIRSGDFSNLLSFSRRRCWVEFWERHWSGLFFAHWKSSRQAAKLGVFCNSPAIRDFPRTFERSHPRRFALVFVVFAIFSKNGSAAGGCRAWAVSCWQPVWGVGLSLAVRRGRDQSRARSRTRIAHAILPIAERAGRDGTTPQSPCLGRWLAGRCGLLVKILAF